MDWPNDAPTVIAIVAALVAFILALVALIVVVATRRKLRVTDDIVRRIETGRTKALASGEQLLSAMSRLAGGYRRLAVSLRDSATVVPDSVQEIATARQDVEKERAVAQLYWPDGVASHVDEVTSMTNGVDADAALLEEKAKKIEQLRSETAKLFKTRYMESAPA